MEVGRTNARHGGIRLTMLSLLAFLALLVGGPAAAQGFPALGLNSSAIYTGSSITDWQAMGRSGAQMFRAQMSMKTFEDHGIKGFDEGFENAAKHGLTLLPLIYGTKFDKPGESPFPKKAEYEVPGGIWSTFLTGLVKRFGQNGTFWSEHPAVPYRPATIWEVWNEPNLKGNNPGGVAEPKNYAAFLKYASQQLRAAAGANPITILFAGLFSGSSGNGNLSVADFLKGAGEEPNTGSSFDALGLHPYSFTVGQRFAGFEERVNAARSNLTSEFGAGKEIWITEIGWPVTPGASPSSVPTPVNEVQQAELLVQVVNWVKSVSASKGIDGVFWYFYRDSEKENVGAWDAHAGLLNHGAAPRRAWWAFQEVAGVPFWPVAPNWFSDNLGGTITSEPDISTWGSNRMDVFARGAENALWTRSWNGSNWGAWGFIGGALSSGPGAVSWGVNRIDVVAHATNGNSVAHWWFDGASWHADDLGGTTNAAPDISSWGPNRLDVFIRGTDNALWHKFWNGAWSVWEFIGGALTSGPSSVSWGNNRIDIVARAADGSVAHWWWTGTGWASDNLGGFVASRPTIASPEPGRLDVFGQGAENALWHREFIQGSGWAAWERVGGPITSAPGAVAVGKNRIDVVARQGASNVGHWWWLRP